MTTAPDMQKVVVLRIPEDQGNFRYWLAELSGEDAQNWEDRLAQITGGGLAPDISVSFGDPLTLPQVMEKLQQRDFQVLDFPRNH